MRHLLNTLFVTTQGAYLRRDGETVQVRVQDEVKIQVPIHNLGAIVCFGRVGCSPALMALCGTRNVLLSFLSEQGRFLARVQGPVSGNILLRRQQYRLADSPSVSARLASVIVAAKASNCRTVLLRASRDRPGDPACVGLEAAATDIQRVIEKLREPMTLEVVRGKEGEVAKYYFGVFDALLTAQKEEFSFRERSRRPPLDNVNAMLSFVYTLLLNDIVAALETVGLDPAVGFLHRDRPGRPSLALDLMEEFRPFLADRLVISLVNRQQVKGSGFARTESGGVMMDDETRKAILVAYQKRKQEEIQHLFLEERVTIGLLPFCQALLLSRHFRGDLDGYPPFFWK